MVGSALRLPLRAFLSVGWLVFGDVPTVATLAGAALVIVSGLFILYRERKLGGGRSSSGRPLLKIPGYREARANAGDAGT